MSDETTPDYGRRDTRLLGGYERAQEAANFATASGNTRRADRYSGQAARRLARLTRRGVGTEGLGISDFQGGFDPTETNDAISYISRQAGQRAQAHGGDSDLARSRSRIALNNKASDLLAQNTLNQRQDEFNTNILPTYTGAMDRLNELAGTNAISAEKEAALRSQIASQNRTAAASNLGRTASALGLRGMADSPAAAALASSVAQDYDIDLTNQLSDMGIKVSEVNREQTRMDAGAAASLAGLRINAENAYLSNDVNAVQNIGRDTAALIDALYSRDKTYEALQHQIDEAGKQSLNERLGQWTDTASGIVKLGADIYSGGLTSSLGGGGGSSTPMPAATPTSYSPAYQYNMPDYGQR